MVAVPIGGLARSRPGDSRRPETLESGAGRAGALSSAEQDNPPPKCCGDAKRLYAFEAPQVPANNDERG